MSDVTQEDTAEDDPSPADRANVSVDIQAEPETVWEALTTSEGLDGWFGEGSVMGEEPGDALHVLDPLTGRPKSGIVETMRPNERLDYTWWPVGEPDDASHVSITLVPSEAGTQVTVVERPLRPGTPVMTSRRPMALASC